MNLHRDRFYNIFILNKLVFLLNKTKPIICWKILLKFFRPTFYHDNDKYYGHKRVQEKGKKIPIHSLLYYETWNLTIKGFLLLY